MLAIVSEEYGGPERLRLEELERPETGPDGIVVRVRAASVNPLDWHTMRGEPYVARLFLGLRRPKSSVRGVDVSGTVEAVGEAVTRFRPGDAVFGGRTGAFAEYVRGTEKNFVPLPAGLTFEEAAAIPVAGVTALQALRDRGRVQPGQRVLVNGAAGGVGTFAVQIAKAFGAEVTGVCSTANVELVGSLGADEVVDYTRDDFTRNGRRYDVVLDNVGNRSLRALRRAATPSGTIVIVGGEGGAILGPFRRTLQATAVSPFVGQRIERLFANIDVDDVAVLKELVEAGKLSPVVDRTYPLAQVREAIRHLETKHARGKTVITVGGATGGRDAD